MAYDDQVSYQIRAEWGVEGLNRLAPTDVIVVVDPLRFSTIVTDRVAAGERIHTDDEIISASINGAPVALAAAKTSALVLVGSLRNAQAVADAIIGLQHERQAIGSAKRARYDSRSKISWPPAPLSAR